MKVVLVVEDRDTGYVILDRASVPDVAAIGQEMELKLRNVSLDEAVNDASLLWVQTDNPDGSITLEIGREEGEFSVEKVLNGPSTSYPIPSGDILLDMAEYDKRCEGY
jgi:hypothetical protein